MGRPKLQLYSVSELANVPEPPWLVKGILPLGSMAGVYGPPGEGKSFFGLDLALSIAAGIDCCGSQVERGIVLYIAAEGGGSIRKRVEAWKQRWQLPDVPDAFFVLEAVQVRSKDELALLVARLRERGINPVLIVVDTMARCFGSGDENSAQEMGEFVDGLEWLKRETGATVMFLHHTGKKKSANAKSVERGSSALRAAVDVMIRVSKKGKLVTVHNDKQKDNEEFKDFQLELRQVAISGKDGDNTSCILVPPGSPSAVNHFVLPPNLRPTLQALASSPGGQATRKQWMRTAGLAERTLDAHRDSLVECGCVESVGRGNYRISEKGRRALGPAATANNRQSAGQHDSPIVPAATATPPLGVADAAEAAVSESEAYEWELDDLLDAYHRELEEEMNRHRVLNPRGSHE